MKDDIHKPVLLNEVLEYLNPKPGDVFIDATINGGGHAQAIADRIGRQGRLLGIDRDCDLIKKFQISRLAQARAERADFKFQIDEFKVVCSTFANIRAIAENHGFTNTDGILFDLGFSSFHITSSGRGFSFLSDEVLDMRYDIHSGISVREIVNTWSEEKIADTLYVYGEERFSRRIARGIREQRRAHPIERAGELVEIIRCSVPAWYRKGRIHFATRTFQALRIAANDELEHVAKGIEDAVSLLGTGGRLVILSFHSLEDRIIKTFFLQKKREGIVSILTKKPIVPSRKEIQDNPRSRSAKMRVAEKIHV